ncbi:hypothetical protein AB0O76_26650 [Streptomyces sp. NPDC086554]|uniref:hypothetical protein n=1 Tax=Streptomyces sp. NPDC086554 TaxID=3154864 RepID=UPI00343CBDDB
MHARRIASRPSRLLRRPVTTATALAATVAVLVLSNLANNRWAKDWSLAASLGATAVLLAIAYWSGMRSSDVGLARGTLARGLRWALALIGVVAAGYTCAALLPVTRDLFEDQRTRACPMGQAGLRAGCRFSRAERALVRAAARRRRATTRSVGNRRQRGRGHLPARAKPRAWGSACQGPRPRQDPSDRP